MKGFSLPGWVHTALCCLHCALTVFLLMALGEVSISVEHGPLYYPVTIYLFYYPLLALWAGALAGRSWRCLPLVLAMPVSAGLWCVAFFQYGFEAGAFLVYLVMSLGTMLFSRWLHLRRPNVLPGVRPIGWALGIHLPLYPALNLLAITGGHPRLAEALWYLCWLGLAVWLGILAGRRFRQRFWMPLLPLCLLCYWDRLPPAVNAHPALLPLPYPHMAAICFGLCLLAMLITALILHRRKTKKGSLL